MAKLYRLVNVAIVKRCTVLIPEDGSDYDAEYCAEYNESDLPIEDFDSNYVSSIHATNDVLFISDDCDLVGNYDFDDLVEVSAGVFEIKSSSLEYGDMEEEEEEGDDSEQGELFEDEDDDDGA